MLSMYGLRLARSLPATGGTQPSLSHLLTTWNWTPALALPPHLLTRSYAKKAKKTTPMVELVEGEESVINLSKVEKTMVAAVQSLKHEYTTSVTTRITPASLERISVDVDGQSYPLKQIAQLGMPNHQTILINMSAYPESVNAVAGAIRATDLNLNPLVDKNTIKIPIPKMTGELRESLAKLAKTHAEKAKVGVRKAKQKGTADLKKTQSVSKDTVHRLEKYLQQTADTHISSIDDMLAAKSAELTKSG